MRLFGFLKKEPVSGDSEAEKILEGAENSEVLIPDHAKQEKAEESMLVQKVLVKNLFRVFSGYDVGSQIMLSGIVESGRIKKKMKTKINGKEAVVADLKAKQVSAAELLKGEEGTVFLKGKEIHYFKQNDTLEFK
jgi:hypothetical protein